MIKLLPLLWTLYVIQAITWKWAKRMEDCIVESKFQIAERNGTGSLSTCLSECQIMSNCQSASWYQFNKTCLLFRKTVLDDNREKYSLWIALDRWKTYSRVEYPVVVRMNSGSTIGNFDLAAKVCLDKFSTIAAPDDLLEARELNMNKCYCGWLSNGLKGLVTSTENYCHKYNFSTNVVYCEQSNAVVWCKLK